MSTWPVGALGLWQKLKFTDLIKMMDTPWWAPLPHLNYSAGHSPQSHLDMLTCSPTNMAGLNLLCGVVLAPTGCLDIQSVRLWSMFIKTQLLHHQCSLVTGIRGLTQICWAARYLTKRLHASIWGAWSLTVNSWSGMPVISCSVVPVSHSFLLTPSCPFPYYYWISFP